MEEGSLTYKELRIGGFHGSACLGSSFSSKSKDTHLREVILVIDLLLQVRMSSSYL